MKLGALIFLAASSPLLFPISIYAADWSSCASDLDSLRRGASNASSMAEEADSKKRNYENAVEEYRNCRSMPSVYDLLRDGCRSKASDAEYARSTYRSALSELEYALNDVNSKYRFMASNCEMTTGATATPGPSRSNNASPLCALYARYIGKLPKEVLLDTCRKSNSATECAKCIP